EAVKKVFKFLLASVFYLANRLRTDSTIAPRVANIGDNNQKIKPEIVNQQKPRNAMHNQNQVSLRS
ncbi:MAG TPA: hypothetical protein VIK86_03375, partial [Candidatus Paceibacterota bacterium]